MKQKIVRNLNALLSEPHGQLLRSSFSIKATMISSQKVLIKHITTNPHMKLVSGGSRLTYSIVTKYHQESPIIELSKDQIKYSFSFSEPSRQTYTRNFITCLSILSFLGDFYRTELKEAYPYLSEIITINNIIPTSKMGNSLPTEDHLVDSVARSNHTLAKKLIEFQKEKNLLQNEAEKLKKTLNLVFKELKEEYHLEGEVLLKEIGRKTAVNVQNNVDII